MPIASSITPTQRDVQTVLRSFLLDVLPAGIEVVSGQANRAPEPSGTSYVVMTPIMFQRGDTNSDGFDDVKFIGSIAGPVMTVASVDHGVLKPGRMVFGVGVADGAQIMKQTSGPDGGAGTYTLSNSQTIALQVLAAGAMRLTQNGKVTVQVDFHSADLTGSDMAQTFSTAFRDEYATTFFRRSLGTTDAACPIIPLHADDPKQMPFINAEQQYEWRWIVSAEIQCNQTIEVPQQFAQAVDVGLIEIDSHYPP